MVYSKTKEIDEHLAEVLLGYVKLEGTVTRMDGSKCFSFTDRDGKQHKYATPRPNGEETVKKRYKNVKGLDPDVGSNIPGATYLDNEGL